ncbi:MAG: sulfotransferase domain-containing protein, partial [Candidatus Peribacteraceae bacterium]|nr:sulfotransferase domain-containing protein [Candidatus Peribacteraceae bacterium]
MAKIQWLASYPKSGNTWVRLFLEAYLLGRVNINNLVTTCGDSNIHYYQPNSCVPYDQLELYDYGAVRLAALHNMVRQNRKTFFCVKTHSIDANLVDIPLIPRGYSDKSVYIVRDPRDVAVSWAKHLGQSIDKTITGMITEGFGCPSVAEDKTLQTLYGSWGQNVRSWGLFPVALVVRYEDLLNDPEKWFG